MSRYPWRDTSKDIANSTNSQWETPLSAQVKANKAEENAKKYSSDQLDAFRTKVNGELDSQGRRINNIVANAGDSNIEIVDARLPDDGPAYATLKERLDKEKEQLNMKINKKTRWFHNAEDFGADATGLRDSTKAIQLAIDSLSAGEQLILSGTYLLTGPVKINKTDVVLTGGGTIITSGGIEIRENRFTCKNLKFIADRYSEQTRAIKVLKDDVEGRSRDIEDILIMDCQFTGFYYSVDFRGGEYNVQEKPPVYFVRNSKIVRCKSTAPVGKNAGHFQHTQTYNATVHDCETFGGKGATSYNFIQSNGYLKVTSNYDHNNEYGSCEIENLSGRGLIQGNTFRKNIWIDDSSNIVIDGNTVEEYIFLTVQNYDLENIIVSDNIVDRIRVEQFGGPQTLTAKGRNITIDNNTINGTGGYGILVSGYGNDRFEDITITNNNIVGNFTNGKIGIVRSDSIRVTVNNNKLNGNIVISGSVDLGVVYVYRNIGGVLSGERNSFPVSFRETSSDGLTLMSENGIRYKLYVGNSGNVYTLAY